jgi:hypothetical protein
MKRKLKQWPSTIPSISTTRTTPSHFNQLNTAKQTPRHCVENLDTGLGYDIQMVAVLNHLMRSQPPSLMFHQRYVNINNRQQIMQLQQQK